MQEFVSTIVDIEMVRKLIHLVKEYRYHAISAYDWCDCEDDIYCAMIRDLDKQAEELGVPGIKPVEGDYHELAKKL